ncbi:glutamate dehydrogenase [Leishmania infantum JPCM5]|uniref:NAD-specific glutamate dehydrogenase n=2 Tax=Leishmania infantum TaxID=5671 RepID=A0A6L0X3U7_LEIIN|nr:glutamate dehydrogenase [Leishmania infantum JPCM5]CAC9472786.1 glutamate_dehydrogenase [Leishmania infantum]CAM66827.2 glutamate dehydrogenase [Leishmania infantum JPCM5]SUZ40521.1 glutamate_dehydrogenase [Leishmania infantum]|eukprot:XP_001464440.2 glutamate dehydrogenase [Leishmania infantum JPCM5]
MMRYTASRAVARLCGRAFPASHTVTAMTLLGFAPLATPGRFASSGATSPLVDRDAIIKAVTTQAVFDKNIVESLANTFVSGLEKSSYPRNFSQAEMIDHVQGLLTAEARFRMGDSFEYVHENHRTAFYICHNEPQKKLRMLRKMARFVSLNQDPHLGSNTHHYISEDRKFAIYNASIEPFVESGSEEEHVNPKSPALPTQTAARQLTEEQKNIIRGLLRRQLSSVFPVFHVEEVEKGHVSFTMATMVERTNYVASLLSIFQEIEGAEIMMSVSYSFSNGVQVYGFEIRGATAEQIEERASLVGLLPNRPFNAITRLHEAGALSCEETVFIDAAVIFAMYFTPSPTTDDYRHLKAILAKEPNGVNRLNNLRSSLTQEVMSERYTGSVIALYPEFVKLIYEDFRLGSTPERRAAIADKITHRLREDDRPEYDRTLFMSFLKFNEVIIKHNFCKTEKAALAFRLNPVFLKELEFPRVPHGVFLFAGGQWRGFHIRFTDIARGGVRMIICKERDYRRNKRSVFQENYNLAHTQLLKNKDIPEGGSKGTILVSSRYLNKFDEVRCQHIFLQYVDALLDVIIPGEKGVVDGLKSEEIIFLGPDENTAGTFPAAGALYSKGRGYKSWKSFTTGKDPELGGIPHDVYGMTTHSVRAYVTSIYEKLGLNESEMRKFQTGGPDGDLGSNELLRSKEKMVGMVDISASLHDPKGIDREELARLAHHRLPLREFNRSKLSPEGFLVLTEDRNVKLPDGSLVEDGSRLRNEFHFLKYSDADVFVPCGGRPRSVTLENVGRFLKIPNADGESMMEGKYANLSPEQLKFKIIVEGANLFISQDARLALEKCGVTLIKDASANKGGVTSSSLEVFAGLCLSDEEHTKYMSAKSATDAPEFYKKYVKEILDRIEENAKLEFNAIWREWEKDPQQSKTLIADALSRKNVQIRASMLSSDIFKNRDLVRYVMDQYALKTLKEVVPVDLMLKRVPENYQHAICAMWLASRYVYQTGVDSNEFDFFRYMTEVYATAAKSAK